MDTIYRKTAFLILFTMLVAFPAWSQQPIIMMSGSVLDAETLEPLKEATIQNLTSLISRKVDEEGYFEIRALPGDTLQIQQLMYHPSRYVVPLEAKTSNTALVQLLKRENTLEAENIRAFPTQQQFEQALLRLTTEPMTSPGAELDQHIDLVRNDPTNMQQYYNDYMRYQQMYVMPERGTPNNFINPERWSRFIRDWREGKFTEDGMEKLEGFPGELKDED